MGRKKRRKVELVDVEQEEIDADNERIGTLLNIADVTNSLNGVHTASEDFSRDLRDYRDNLFGAMTTMDWDSISWTMPTMDCGSGVAEDAAPIPTLLEACSLGVDGLIQSGLISNSHAYEMLFSNHLQDSSNLRPETPPVAMEMVSVIRRRQMAMRESYVLEAERGMTIEQFICQFGTFQLNMGRCAGHTSLAFALLENCDGDNAVLFYHRLTGIHGDHFERIRRSRRVHPFNGQDIVRGRRGIAGVHFNMVIVDSYSQFSRQFSMHQLIQYFLIDRHSDRCPFYVFLG
jgi:hypothetical protein